jgi:hypothetical protein
MSGPIMGGPIMGSPVAHVALVLALASQAGPATIRPDLSDPSRLARDWTLDGSGVWAIRDGLLVLEKKGVPSGPIRRPAALALVQSEPLADVTLDLEIRSTAPDVKTTPRRDVLLVAGYQSPTRFYYVHISAVRDDVHHGIFLVDGADRKRIDTVSIKPPLVDAAWHRARLVRRASSGRIEVFVDDMREPILVASDTTLGTGRVGVGSFDDTGEFRRIVVTGR